MGSGFGVLMGLKDGLRVPGLGGLGFRGFRV